MASSIFAAGNAANAVFGAQGVTPTPAAAVNTPVSHLTSNKLWEPFLFGSAVTDSQIVFDVNMIPDPSFEAGTPGQGANAPWVTSGATIATDDFNTGSQSLKFDDDGDESYVDINCIAGNTYRYDGFLSGDDANTLEVEIIDLQTGRYKTGGDSTTWNDLATSVTTQTLSGFTQFQRTFTIQAQPDGRTDRVKVRIRLFKSGGTNSDAYADDITVYPQIDTAALIGSDHFDRIDAEIWSGTTSAANTTNHGTFPVKGVRTFMELASVPADPRRYWRLFYDGTNTTRAILLNQLWLFERITFIVCPSAREPITHSYPQRRVGDDTAVPLVSSTASAQRIRHMLQFGSTIPGLDQAIERFFLASEGGVEPVLVIPDSDDIHRVIHGRLPAEMVQQLQSVERADFSYELVEDPIHKRVN